MISVVTRFVSASRNSPHRRVAGEFVDLFQLRCGRAAGEAENLKRQEKAAQAAEALKAASLRRNQQIVPNVTFPTLSSSR